MQVSVLIATYGSEEWHDLAWSRAWPSAQNQGASEVLVFHDPDGTISSVRNELANTAHGEWLLFLDADDELAPGFLDAMRRAYEQEKSCGDSFLLTPAVQQIRKAQRWRPHFWPEQSLEDGNWLPIGTLVPRDLFIRVEGFPEFPLYEDWGLWLKCVRAGARIVKVRRAVYVYHYNPDSEHHRRFREQPWQSLEHARVKAELDAWQPTPI